MVIDRIEQRVLGALRIVDSVTGQPVKQMVLVGSEQAELVRNRNGLYVITNATDFEEYIGSFDTPSSGSTPAPQIVHFHISDPLSHYLPRIVELSLPRNPDSEMSGSNESVFTPVDVALYPSSTAPIWHNWSTVRVSVARESDNSPIPGALLRVVDAADNDLLASGISDTRGEALVIVSGVPITKFADELSEGEDDVPPVVVHSLPVRLELSLGASTPWPVNPDLLERDHVTNRRMSVDVALSTGQMERVVINLA